MRTTRRRFLKHALGASAALSAGALEALFARARGDDAPADTSLAAAARLEPWQARGYGPLIPDPAGILDLPAGFQYRAYSSAVEGRTDHPRFSEKLPNGEWVPCRHDGMGAFEGPDGITILVRNHEVDLDNVPHVDQARARPYDPLAGGGTTTLWIDRDRNLVKAFPSLSGTVRNCAGGVTPWASWLTCEECVYLPGEKHPVIRDRTPLVSKRHGHVFEVDSRAEELVDPAPILPMGRFYHEACAVDPATGFVYMTEDRNDGALYRFRPAVLEGGRRTVADMKPGDLAKGGTLEALRLLGHAHAKTQNWENPFAFRPGEPHRIGWVPVPNIDPDMDEERDPRDEEPDPLKRRGSTAKTSTRAQAFANGAAQFARVEGITYGRHALYWCATDGGPAGAGQVWKLDLVRDEISLVVQPDDLSRLDGPDNITVAPNGDLLVCEDGTADDYVVGVTPNGRLYHLAHNAYNDVEFAGACFSPDRATLYVNIQDPGITFAVWGPWAGREA